MALSSLVLDRHHQLTACGAREAIRAIHVFNRSGRMHEGARRYRPHQVGYARAGDRRGVAVLAVVLTAAAHIQANHPEVWGLVYFGTILGMALTLVLTYLVLRAASSMVRFLGRSGIDAMTRMFGFLLVCIGMQFVLTGVADFYGLH